MPLLIGLAVVVVLGTIAYWMHEGISFDWKDPADWFFAVLMLMVSCLFAAIPLMFVTAAATAIADINSDEVHRTRTEIVALADGTNLEGAAYLFGGTIESKPVYCYYYNHRDGGYAQNCIGTRNTTIVEDDDAYIERIYQVAPHTWYNAFGQLSFDRAVIHVPNGTIVRQFNLDLE